MVNKSSRGYHFAFSLCIAVMLLRPFVVIVSEVMSMLILYAVHSLASSELSGFIFVAWTDHGKSIYEAMSSQFLLLFSGKGIIVCRAHPYLLPIGFAHLVFTLLVMCLILLQPTLPNSLTVEHGKEWIQKNSFYINNSEKFYVSEYPFLRLLITLPFVLFA